MYFTKKIWICLFLAIALISLPVYAEKDLDGSHDHPLISRYEGSIILYYESVEFDKYTLALGKVTREILEEGQLSSNHGVTQTYRGNPTTLEPSEYLSLEGRVTKITYIGPEERSVLEIYRNYENEIERAGFETLFSASGEEVNEYGNWHGLFYPFTAERYERIYYLQSPENPRYMAAKLSRAEGDVYISLYIHQGGMLTPARSAHRGRAKIQIDIVEVRPMDEGLLTVDTMYEDLARKGFVSIYGIQFDYDSAKVKKESEHALGEIAMLLQEYMDFNLYVVGHTDDVGSLEYNLSLSERRSEAIVDILVNTHGIASNRLIAAGVGPLSPVSNNKTESGQAMNRRVELVLRH
jgi:outer membrane protein OmpA-like peptidoglycan-associated protein